jgi:hypothetical protein
MKRSFTVSLVTLVALASLKPAAAQTAPSFQIIDIPLLAGAKENYPGLCIGFLRSCLMRRRKHCFGLGGVRLSGSQPLAGFVDGFRADSPLFRRLFGFAEASAAAAILS